MSALTVGKLILLGGVGAPVIGAMLILAPDVIPLLADSPLGAIFALGSFILIGFVSAYGLVAIPYGLLGTFFLARQAIKRAKQGLYRKKLVKGFLLLGTLLGLLYPFLLSLVWGPEIFDSQVFSFGRVAVASILTGVLHGGLLFWLLRKELRPFDGEGINR